MGIAEMPAYPSSLSPQRPLSRRLRYLMKRLHSYASVSVVLLALVLAACETTPASAPTTHEARAIPASAAARAFGDGIGIPNFRDVAFGATIELRKSGILIGQHVPTATQLEAITTFIDSSATPVTRPAIEQAVAFSILNPIFVAQEQRFSPRPDLAPYERAAVRFALDLLVKHHNPTVDLLYAALLSIRQDLPTDVVTQKAAAMAAAYDARLAASKQGCVSCGYGREQRTAAFTDARLALDDFLGS